MTLDSPETCSATAARSGERCQRPVSKAGRCGLHQPTLPDVTADGDRRRSLEALRQVLAEAIADDPAPRDLASLSLRLMNVLEELEQLTPVEEKTVVDDLAARRAERRPTAAGA